MSLLHVIFIAALAKYGSAATIDDCPSNVPRDHLRVFQDICYRINMHRERDWSTALRECQSLGGTLALVKSKEINDFLVKGIEAYGRKEDVWIGLTDMKIEGEFYWEDGTKMDYSNWSPNEGQVDEGFLHHGEDCVAMDEYGKWYDYPCQSNLFSPNIKPYICQYKVSNAAVTSGPATTKPAPPTTTPAPTTATPVPTTTTPAPTTSTPAPTTATPTPTTTTPALATTTPVPTIIPQTSTTSSLGPTVKGDTAPCPAFTCQMDCELDGFKKDPQTGCSICECDV